MKSRISLLILTLLIVCLVHGSIVSKKKKTPSPFQTITIGEEHDHLQSDTLLHHQAKRQAIEPVKDDNSLTQSNGIETISSECSNIPSLDPVQQHVPQLNGKVSVLKSSKKKCSAVLLDETNTVEEVPVEEAPIVVHDTLEREVIPHEEDPTPVPFRVLLSGGKFHRYYQLPWLPNVMREKDFSLTLHDVFSDHVIGFHFYHMSDTLFVKPILFNFTSGQIKLQLMGLKKAVKGDEQDGSSLDPVNAPLINGVVLPLGRPGDVQNLIQDNDYVQLIIDVSIVPNYHDILIKGPPQYQTFLREVRQIPQYIKRLMDEGWYKEIEMHSNYMTDDERMKYICPAINNIEQYNNLVKCLKRHKMIPGFFVYGRMEAAKSVIEYETSVVEDYIDHDDFKASISLALRDDQHNRVIDLLEISREITAEADEYCQRENLSTSFEDSMETFFVKFRPWENSAAIKRFLTFHKDELNGKHSIVLKTFCQVLIGRLKPAVNKPDAKKLLIDLIGQPSLLTPKIFVTGFLSVVATDRIRSLFIKCCWDEAMREGLKMEYKNGGEKLWRIVLEEYPNKFPEGYPPSDEVLTAVLKEFPTRQLLEERWVKENAPTLQKKIEGLHLYLFPTVLLTIISEYAVTWFDV